MRIRHLFLVVLLMALPARAHQTSDSYLSLEFTPTNITGQWDMAVKDLALVVPLDDNKDGEITETEIQAHQLSIAEYAVAQIKPRIDGASRNVQITSQTVTDHLTGPYVELHLTISGASEGKELEITSTLFLAQHPEHIGMFLLDYLGQKQASVFTENKTTQTFLLLGPVENKPEKGRQFFAFAKQGVWHIWRGYDHILFLLALLFPSVLRRKADRWIAVENFRPALFNVLKIVTSFTVAHSITLSLATLNVIQLPTRLTESAIAASVILAALNNIFPFFTGRFAGKEWLVTFAFGLIHGFGFASALSEMGFTRENLALTLVGFNLGVEAGQLAVVSVFLPIAFAFRRTWIYQRLILAAGSSVIILIAAGWMIDRISNLNFMPF